MANARAVAQGQDPRVSTTTAPTFQDAADKVITLHAANWKDGSRAKSVAQWQATLDAYAMPRLGNRPVDRITIADVMAVLLPIWNDKRETARRVRLRAIFKWSVAQGYRDDNPAGDAIGAALLKNGVHREHHRALAHSDVAGALQRIRNTDAWPATKLALQFLVLTACRSGEVSGATWSEVDLEGTTWTVPAERMKAGKEHRVPLSDRALGVLDEARTLTDGSGLICPSQRGKVLSNAAVSQLVRTNNLDAVPHGFRSSFRDWCGDTGVARKVAEARFTHTIKNQVEAAYARSDLLERRRDAMQQWADYLVSKIA